MKVKKPIEVVPSGTRGKYRAIWDRVFALKPGHSLPVECESTAEARLLYISAMTRRTKKIQASIRGTTVYLQNPRKRKGR